MGKREGDLYEEKVAEHLSSKGVQILERNYRSRFGEIDILAKVGEKLLLVEVKGGKNSESLPYRVDCPKVRRLLLTLSKWLEENHTPFEELIVLVALVKEGKISFRRAVPEDCLHLLEDINL